MPILRPIEKKDNAAIAGIIRSVLTEFGAAKPGTVYFDPTTDHLFEMFSRPGAAYWIAEEDGTVIGGGGVYPTEGLPPGCCELVKLYLVPSARGTGLGRMLMEKSFQSARGLGFSRVYLETMPELRTAIGLYEKAGFTYLEGPMGNSGHCGCDLWMIRDI